MLESVSKGYAGWRFIIVNQVSTNNKQPRRSKMPKKKKPVKLSSLHLRDYTKVTTSLAITEPIRDLFREVTHANFLSGSAVMEKLVVKWMIEEGYLVDD